MTEPQAKTERTNGTKAIVPVDEGAAISAFASSANFNVAQRIATALMQSELLPTAYRGNLPNILIAMEIASRCGASVLAVMQNMDIINGQPSWRSKFLIATVNASGRFTPLRYRWQGTEGTDTWGCRVVAKDMNGEECVGPLVSIALAKAEGWVSRKGSKWATLPELMLMYRAAAFWTRVYAPEISLGMTSEESDEMHAPTVVVTNLPPSLVPGSTKDLEADLLGKPREPKAPVVLDMPLADYHPDTGELIPPAESQ